MELLDTATIFSFHHELSSIYGTGSELALGWKSSEAQLARYKVLAGIGDLNNRSVLDAGCGHGDLRNYLGSIYPNIRYFGIELVPALLQVAIERYGDLPNTTFFEADFSSAALPHVDYAIACGSLNYRNSDPLYVFKMIEKLFNSCRLGLGFNLLSQTGEFPEPISSCNPAFIMDFCQKLSSNVKLVDGYTENDFTISMYH